MKKNTQAYYENLTQVGRYGDGENLYLAVGQGGTKSWKYIWSDKTRRHPVTGKPVQREMGLGSFDKVDVKAARLLRNQIAEQIVQGLDPLAERVEQRVMATRFRDIADELIELYSAAWKANPDAIDAALKGEDAPKNPRTAKAWKRSFELHCGSIWSKPCADITTDDVVAILQPMWKRLEGKKGLPGYPTACLLMDRIFKVLSLAAKRGAVKEGAQNPAVYKGHLEFILGAHPDYEQQHFAAFDPNYLPKVMLQLSAWQKTPAQMIAAKAIMLVILTGVRSSNVFRARWDEFDLEARVWRLSKGRMKGSVPFVVPLSDAALAVLKELRQAFPASEYVFPAERVGKRNRGHMNASAMDLLLCDYMGYRGDATVHGMRTSLSTWANRIMFDRHATNLCLAHQPGSKSDKAYDGEEMLAYRHEILSAWADHCAGKLVDGAERVMTALRRQNTERFGLVNGGTVVSLHGYGRNKKKAA